MSQLVLIRHAQSLWNEKGIWTGKTDISLSEKGKKDAQNAARLIKDISFDIAFTSMLKRAKETLDEMRSVIQVPNTVIEDKALNERDYGDLTGKNKEEVREHFGQEQFLKWRRSFDIPPPNGESLKDVYNRVVPFYQDKILPVIEQGKNALIVAHGNSLRALIKYLDHISDKEIPGVEIPTGSVIVYTINIQGEIENKEVRKV